MRYSIDESEHGVEVKCIDEKRTLNSRETLDLISSFIRQKYIVKSYYSFMVLSGKTCSVRMSNAALKSHDSLLAALQKSLIYTLENYGYIDMKKRENATIKPNREKSQKFDGTKVVAGSMAAIMASTLLTLSLHRGVEQGSLNDKELKTTTENSIMAEQLKKSIDQILENDMLKEVASTPQNIHEELLAWASESDEKTCLVIPDMSAKDKAVEARGMYTPYMEKNALDFGLDPNLLLGICTQERGTHSSKIDKGGGLGLMQIQYDVWIGQTIDCYKLDYQTGQFARQKILVTDELLKSLEGNIEVGSAILQTCMRYADYNIPLAIQMYNQGCGAMKYIVETYCQATGKDYEAVVSDPEDLGWFDYCSLCLGDPNYLVNVNQWVANREYTVTNVYTGEQVNYSFTDKSHQL